MGKIFYHSLEELRSEIISYNLDLEIKENTSSLFDLIELPGNKNHIIRNRLAFHPMEGFDADSDGNPTSLTKERYKRFGRSGAGLVWFEATAVVPEGRSNPHQLMINQKNITRFKELITSFDEGRSQLLSQFMEKSNECFQHPLKILQLTHSGRYSKPGVERYPYRVTSLPELDAVMKIPPENGEIVTDEYLDSLQKKYLECVDYAVLAGFDGVDIKSCHGYLISEMLGAYTRTSSKYGGESIEKRGKFLIDVIKQAIQRYPDHIITLRINLFDVLAYPYGFSTRSLTDQGVPDRIELSDLHALLNKLHKSGVRLVSFSAGNPYYKPYLSRPFMKNAFNGSEAPEHPLFSYSRIVQLLREIAEYHPELVTIGTAYSWFRQYAPYLAMGEIERNSFQIAGFGRMAFAYPTFPVDLYLNGKINQKNVCIACSKCTELMRMNTTTGCVIRNPFYSKIYKDAFKQFHKN